MGHLFCCILIKVKHTQNKLLFFLLFDVLLILLFLFSGTFLSIYIIGLSSILFLFYFKWLDFSKISFLKKIFLAWLVFIISLFLSSLFTNSIPLTLDQVIFYIFSFNFFSFFSLTSKKELNKNIMLFSIFPVMLVMNFFSLILFFFKNTAELIPGMNLLYSTYGHNHFGSLLIMIIPVCWFYLVEFWNKKEKQSALFISGLLLLSIINLLISFGRVLVFIGFLEIMLLGFLYYKNFISKNLLFKITYIFFSLFFIFILSFKLIISVLPFFNLNYSCESLIHHDLRRKICKPLSQEARFHYWKTGLISIKDNWLFGYGPGTYSLINTKYNQTLYSNSAYAHNAYLQTFAESGIFVFISFTVLMILNILTSLKKIGFKLFLKKASLESSLFIGLLAIYIDALFDFDWSFLGVFVLTLLFIAIIINSPEKNNREKNKFDNLFYYLIRVIFVVSNLLLILYVAIIVIVEIFMHFGKVNQAIDFFPYHKYHMLLFLKDESINEKSLRKLDSIYSGHAIYYEGLDQEKVLVDYRDKVNGISPWYYYSFNKLTDLYLVQPELVEQELSRIGSLFDSFDESENTYSYYVIDKELAILANKIGDDYLKSRNIDKAAYFYLLGFKFDNYVWDSFVPAFSYLDLSNNEKKELWEKLESIEPFFLLKNTAMVAKTYFSLADSAFEENNFQEYIHYVNKIGIIADWIKQDYLLDNESAIQEKIDQLINKDELATAEDLLKVLSNSKFSYWGNVQLANFYFLRGEDSLAKHEFERCNQEWIENNKVYSHYDCNQSIELIDNGEFHRNRYYEVSNIIRGENL